ncbi:unnamed protein product [Oikopleura dioica]|uniref:Uncharacterized protein n=1 Tax=Oikopleura dioica TaxID=34765 RepID=E4XSV6_OIKDI|nr:unnamed protein product [Oikopleura dioica]
MNFKKIFSILISVASATLQAAYLNKMSNAISSFNHYRGRKSSVPSFKQQIYNFQRKNAETNEQLFELMEFYAAQNKRTEKRRNRLAKISFLKRNEK